MITVAFSGDYGKPRPAVIIQSDLLTETGADSILVCMMTSDIYPVNIRRLTVLPKRENGLLKPSQIMVEKIFAVRRERCGPVIGSLDNATMDELGNALMFVTGLMG